MPEIILFVAGIVAVQIIPISFFHGDLLEQIQTEEAFMISMFMLLSTLSLVYAMGLATILSNLMLKRPWYKLVFNLINSTIAVILASVTAHFIGGLNGAAIGAILYTVLTATGVFLLFRYMHTRLLLDIPFRTIILGTSLLLGLAMYTNLAIMPIIAMIAVGMQMWYQSTKSPEPVFVEA